MEKYVGKNLIKPDVVKKALGQAKYAGDIVMDNMLHLALVRSEYAHAEVTDIDTSALPEGVTVFTADDLAENLIVDIITDEPVFAQKVLFKGEPVAMVAAETRDEAIKAASLVKVSYNVLPPVLDAEEGAKEDAVKLKADGNVFSRFFNEKGNVEEAFKNCDLIVEDCFTVPPQEHAYIEPEAGVAWMEEDGVHLYTSSQSVFRDKEMVCGALGLGEDKVHVKAATIGGAFGGKDGHNVQIFVALAAYKTGRPAKLVFSREESITCTYKRHGIKTYVKMGFSKDGKILAYDAKGFVDTGAYVGYGASVLGLYCEHLPGPYLIPNIRLEGQLVFTNTVTASAFRGFGVPQGAFATESVINRAADALGIDPIDIRIKNAIKQGDRGSVDTLREHTEGIELALRKMKETDLWKSREENADPTIGYGVAAGHLSCGFGKHVPDFAEVEIIEEADGVKVMVGFTDLGQGSTASLRAIAADALQMPIEKVTMVMSDTDVTYNCGCAAASRSTFIGGNAIVAAAEIFKAKKAAGETNIRARAKEDFPQVSEDVGRIGVPHVMFTNVVQAAKVKVDPMSGQVKVLDFVDVTEAGTIVNPMQFAGQSHGGGLQSIGYAVSEGCFYAPDGTMKTADFTSYLIPTALDAPNMTAITVESYEPTGPFGVKGGAEAPTVPAAAAVTAAVVAVTGAYITALPIDPEINLRAIMRKRGK